MAESKKGFWSTMPGLITGVAAIVTGLGALVPVVLHSSHASSTTTPPAASSPSAGTPTPGASSSLPAFGETPSPSDTSSGATPDASPSASPAGPGAAGMSATPAALDLGRAASGSSTPPATVALANPGSSPAVLDGFSITGPNAAQFAIASTTCGTGTALAPQGSCQVSIRFTAASVGPAAATLEVRYHAPQATVSVPLTGTGSLL